MTSGTMESYTVDVWSGNHPFYTKSDTAMLSDEGRVSYRSTSTVLLGTICTPRCQNSDFSADDVRSPASWQHSKSETC